MVIEQLNNFVIILLIVAAILSAVLGEYIDAGAILAIVLLNTILGVVQETRAEEALAALQRWPRLKARCCAMASGSPFPRDQLVPGDIVFLEAGNLRAGRCAAAGSSEPARRRSGADRRVDTGAEKRRIA